MANTIAKVLAGIVQVPGNHRESLVDLTIVDNYATGGWPYTFADMGFSAYVSHVDLPSVIGYTLQYDYANSKIKVWSGLAELANASAALAAQVIRIKALGK